jgi:hypothetical protein
LHERVDRNFVDVIGMVMRPLRKELILNMDSGDARASKFRTVRMVCNGSPKPAPASASTGISTAFATSLETATCSVIVTSGSETASFAPTT